MKISVLQNRQYDFDAMLEGQEWTLDGFLRKRNESLKEVLQMAEEAARKGAQLTVTTEGVNRLVSTADPRFEAGRYLEPLDGGLIRRFGGIAEKYGSYLVAGLYTEQGGKPYNTAVLFGPGGEILGYYNKTHIPIGENVTPGDRLPVFDTDFGRLGILICWDMQFPEAARELSLAGADLICCPTWGWENIYGLCRAYENSVTIAAANALPAHGKMWPWCDPSCIVDHMGRIVSRGGRRKTGIVTAEVDIKKEPPPQYFTERITGLRSMRQIRTIQRRPDLYRRITEKQPPLLLRYRNSKSE